MLQVSENGQNIFPAFKALFVRIKLFYSALLVKRNLRSI